MFTNHTLRKIVTEWKLIVFTILYIVYNILYPGYFDTLLGLFSACRVPEASHPASNNFPLNVQSQRLDEAENLENICPADRDGCVEKVGCVFFYLSKSCFIFILLKMEYFSMKFLKNYVIFFSIFWKVKIKELLNNNCQWTASVFFESHQKFK